MRRPVPTTEADADASRRDGCAAEMPSETRQVPPQRDDPTRCGDAENSAKKVDAHARRAGTGAARKCPFCATPLSQQSSTLKSSQVESPEFAARCLAVVLHNRLRLAVGQPSPSPSGLTETGQTRLFAVFLEPPSRPTSAAVGRRGVHRSNSLSSASSPPSPSSEESEVSTQGPLHGQQAMPDLDAVADFWLQLLATFQLSAEVGVLALAYLERLRERTGVTTTPDNWQRLTLAALVLASKVWDDDPFENAELAQLCPLRQEELDTLERALLEGLSYDISVGSLEYSGVLYLLRSLGMKDPGECGLRPLDPQMSSQLAWRCKQRQTKLQWKTGM
eukprot:gnl/TRDRNA2_/TRDRNA2_160571_c0_seq2.p1 gnl/TRDRNA2_/TRDRNA2_160571_c0~~gnl/TRDRNA2_/TRDRNA2_160571_c0_seq2.p1  ORF type:complete len:334 (+),score=46.35 gnl/TRDRNA2_/TRDRNA2_160571_c0_seq2:222-1223(+)